MSSCCDVRTRRPAWLRSSHACSANVHELCEFLLICPCACHVQDLHQVLEQLLSECDRRSQIPRSPALPARSEAKR
jgi:hypothetical protein